MPTKIDGKKASSRRLELVKTFLDFSIIFFISCIVRFLHLKYWNAALYSQPVCDELDFHLQAMNLVNGRQSLEVFTKGPLLGYLISFFYNVFGPNYKGVLFFHGMLGAINCGLTYLLGLRVVSRSMAILSGILLAFYTPAVFFDTQILRPVWLTFFILLFLLCFSFSHKLANRKYAAIAGLFLGFATITKAVCFVIFLLFLMYSLVKFWQRKSFAGIAFFIFFTFVPIFPITISNLYYGQDLVFISANGGINFFVGNNSSADGTTPIQAGIEWQRAKRIESRWSPARPSKRAWNWYKQGGEFIINNPFKAARLLGQKFIYFIGPIELRNNRSLYFCKRESPVLNIPFLGFSCFFVLGIFGLVQKRNNENVAYFFIVIVAFAAINVIFFSCARYRAPVLPILILSSFISISCYKSFQMSNMRKKQRSWLLIAIFMLGGILWQTSHMKNPNFSRDWFFLGNLAFKKSNLRLALSCFKNASISNPDDPDPVLVAGVCFERLGKLSLAKAMYTKVLRLAPDYIEAIQNLASILIRENRYDLAEVLLKRSLELDKLNYFSLFNLGVIKESQGKLQLADKIYSKLAQGGNIKPLLANNLALVWLRLGKNKAKALSLLKTNSDSKPDNAVFQHSMGVGYLLSDELANAYYHLDIARKLAPNSSSYEALFQKVNKLLYGN